MLVGISGFYVFKTIPLSNTQIIDQVKTWLTPCVISVLGMFIWRDLGELRADVKQLLAQSTEDHIKIARLEDDVDLLNKRVFLKEGKLVFGDNSQNWEPSATSFTLRDHRLYKNTLVYPGASLLPGAVRRGG